MRRTWIAALGLVAIATPALASEKVFHLKNGRQIQGELVEETQGGYLVKTSGGTTTLRKDLVASVEDAPDRRPEPQAGAAAAPSDVPRAAPTQVVAARRATPAPTPPTNERDEPDAKGLVPSFARLGATKAVPEARDVRHWFKDELDKLLEATSDPGAVTKFVRENWGRSPTNLEYVERLMQTWHNAGQRRGLWQAWIDADSANAEERIIPFATSDVWNARVDACSFLATYGTWAHSTDALLRVIALPHETSGNAAYEALSGMARRALPGDAIEARLQKIHRAGNSEPARWWALRVLAVASQCGSRTAARYVRATYMKAERPEKVNLLEPVLMGLEPAEAHDHLVSVLNDDSADGRAQWSNAAHALARFGGSFADLPHIMRLPARGNDVIDTGLGKLSVAAVVLDVAPVLAKRPRFESLDDAKAWWESVRPSFEGRSSLESDVAASGPRAVAALEKLAEIRLPDVDEALRHAASSNTDAASRAAAAKLIARRGDRKGAWAVLAAFRLADAATREAVVLALRSLAKGESVPTVDPAATLDWWRRRFPDDFAEAR